MQAILANPDDDGPRISYAKELTRQGDPRGEFITVQCALAGTLKNPKQRGELERRERALLDTHRVAWCTPAGIDPSCAAFHRGFIDRVLMNAGQLTTLAPSVVRLHPVRHARVPDAELTSPRATVALIKLCEQLRISSLDLRGTEVSAEALKSLGKHQSLASIRALDLSSSKLEPEGLRALASSRYATGLVRLAIRRNFAAIPYGDLSALCDADALEGLRALDLSYNALNSAALAGRASWRRLAALEELSLAHTRVGDEAVSALVTKKSAPKLNRLDLSGSEVTAGVLGPLEKLVTRGALRFIDLSYTACTPTDVVLLARALPAGGVVRVRQFPGRAARNASERAKLRTLLDSCAGALQVV